MQLQTINERWLSTKTQDVIPKHNLPHTVCLEIRPITEAITVEVYLCNFLLVPRVCQQIAYETKKLHLYIALIPG